MKRFLSIVLCILMLTPSLSAVFASDGVITIGSAEDFLTFAKNASLDTYSAGKTFCLTDDIDLSDAEFRGVPYFAGTFNGAGHTVSGLSVTGDGSRYGLFRTLAEGAVVSDLNVVGEVTLGGTGENIGGIVGENYGTVQNCSFDGNVSGVTGVGGIAGLNADCGVVTGCVSSGSVTGEHKVGGIAGESGGIVLSCENKSCVNTAEVETSGTTSFDISSLSEEDILDITDIGGVVGYSVGIVCDCINRESVGYAHTGYNVGGIAGRSCGYVADSQNYGKVLGRKDTGGIIGQMEPAAEWDFSKSKLSSLDEEIKKLDSLASSALGSVQEGSKEVYQKLESVKSYTSAALLELEGVMNTASDDVQSISDSSAEALCIIQSALENSPRERAKKYAEKLLPVINGEITSVRERLEIFVSLLREVKGDLKGVLDDSLVSELVTIISETKLSVPNLSPFLDNMESAASALGEADALVSDTASNISYYTERMAAQISTVYNTFITTVQDITDVDTDFERDISSESAYEHSDGAADSCTNNADVSGDTNVGGIVGNISYEISFDLEDELNLSDYILTDAEYRIFAVVRRSESYGTVTAKKKCAGGIAGNMSLGALCDSVFAGSVTVESGDYAGGIAGKSSGAIVSCSSRVDLSGEKYIGGIVGAGKNISDCRTIAYIGAGLEYIGAVAGFADGDTADNLFVDYGVGGIDGVSFSEKAEPIAYASMMELDGVPDAFGSVIVTFSANGETVAEVEVPFGGAVEALPEVAPDGDKCWRWNDFDREHVYHSMTVEGCYITPCTTLSSDGDIPLFLAEGIFEEGQTLTYSEYSPDLESESLSGEEILAAYTLSVDGYNGELTVRMRAEEGELYVLHDGEYVNTSFERDGSYIVFPLESGGSFVLVKNETHPYIVVTAVAALLVTAFVMAVFIVKKRQARRKRANTPSDFSLSE